MRALFAFLTLACAMRVATAGEAHGSSETLVGWSTDGTHYAVTGFDTDGKSGPEFFLEVRHDGKSVYRWVQPEDPQSMSPDRIDVETWGPVKKFALKKLDAPAARKRFAAQLVAGSTTRAIDRYRCGAGGWSVKKKGGAALREETARKDRCFRVTGGYLNQAGSHALVKLREAWQLPASKSDGSRTTYEQDRFVLVRL
jgi:hypothetical protein